MFTFNHETSVRALSYTALPSLLRQILDTAVQRAMKSVKSLFGKDGAHLRTG